MPLMKIGNKRGPRTELFKPKSKTKKMHPKKTSYISSKENPPYSTMNVDKTILSYTLGLLLSWST